MQLVGPVGRDHEHALAAQGAREIDEEGARRAVGPVQVLDRDHQAVVARQQFEQLEQPVEQPRLRGRLVVGVARAEARQDLGQRAARRVGERGEGRMRRPGQRAAARRRSARRAARPPPARRSRRRSRACRSPAPRARPRTAAASCRRPRRRPRTPATDDRRPPRPARRGAPRAPRRDRRSACWSLVKPSLQYRADRRRNAGRAFRRRRRRGGTRRSCWRPRGVPASGEWSRLRRQRCLRGAPLPLTVGKWTLPTAPGARRSTGTRWPAIAAGPTRSSRRRAALSTGRRRARSRAAATRSWSAARTARPPTRSPRPSAPGRACTSTAAARTPSHGDTLFFCNDADQRIHRVDGGGEPRPITPEPATPFGLCYADLQVTGDWLLCVREREGEPEHVNELVALPADGSAEPHVIAHGHDFYSAPRVSPDGQRVAWLTWDHPRMPWEGSELWVADFVDGELRDQRLVAGGAAEAIVQPEWSPDGVLHFSSDRTGWWNLYRGDYEPVTAVEAEIGGPLWVFGESWYAFLPDGRIVCVVFSDGSDRLAVVEHDGTLRYVDLELTRIVDLTTDGERALFVGASPTRSPSIIAADLDDGRDRGPQRRRRRGRRRRLRLRPAPAELSDDGRQDRPRALLSPAPPGLPRARRASGRRCWSASTAARPPTSRPRSRRRSSSSPAAASPSWTSTTAAAPATAASTATGCAASGASSTPTTPSTPPARSRRRARSTARGWRSPAAAPAAGPCSARWPSRPACSRPARTTTACPTSRRFGEDTHKFESRYDDWLDRPVARVRGAAAPALADQPRRQDPRAGDHPPGPRGQGRPAVAVRARRRRARGQRHPVRVPRVRGRAARVPQGRDAAARGRGRALVLRPGLRLRARRPDRAGRRSPGRRLGSP